MTARRERPVTGRTVLAACLGAFAVVIAANGALLAAALGSFPGLVVRNSYVASQEFDDRRARAEARGWTLSPGWTEGTLALDIRAADGSPVRGATVIAVIGRPARAATDRTVTLARARTGYAVPIDLAPGRWQAAFTILPAEGPPIEFRSTFTVGG